ARNSFVSFRIALTAHSLVSGSSRFSSGLAAPQIVATESKTVTAASRNSARLIGAPDRRARRFEVWIGPRFQQGGLGPMIAWRGPYGSADSFLLLLILLLILSIALLLS